LDRSMSTAAAQNSFLFYSWNRREQLGGRRVRLTDDQRRRLAAKTKGLGRKLLAEMATMVTPETLLAWHGKLRASIVWPRSDCSGLAVTKGDGGMDVMMGELVLLQKDVNPVSPPCWIMGLEATALHNHFFFEEPRIFCMHGHGNAEDLARRAKPAVDLIGNAARPAPASGTGSALSSSIGAARIAQIVGHAGEQIGPVYKITIGPDDLTFEKWARRSTRAWA